ncbi:hypothetical protein C482_02036 [Natrialba chahannaoensis JCM 10990]|uniref:Uncharacterized protein n=1 Tax=Natrialba chahannaoensis JCM 10990 TaxID=1227492 RepID=M0B5W3_9EURY|nr:hypothetical protein [Natrialba chahannaoensis]ELZ05653.1 hypothetical protein C482_02036 [Natrialba chahannaoensis JCM 10990]
MSGRRDPRRQAAHGNKQQLRRLGLAFVLLVGFSGGTMALQGGASLQMVALSTLGFLVAGGALLWYLQWIVS